MGTPISVNEAEEYVFGFVLMNDWSARDIQTWESNRHIAGKKFATTISPWIVTQDALAYCNTSLPKQSPELLEYLQDPNHSSYDIEVFLGIQPQEEPRPYKVVQTNLLNQYWSFKQQIAHHTSSGCNLRVGSLIATGSLSGQESSSFGSGLERKQTGDPIKLKDGITREYLEDGDEVVIIGAAIEDKNNKIGFGECRGKIVSCQV